jgi:outer membrane protein W
MKPYIKFFFIAITLFFFLNTFENPYSQVKEKENKFFDQSKKFTAYVFASYISSAEVQNNLDSSDPIERASLTNINGGFGFGLEFNFRPNFLNLDLDYYISSDYVRLNQKDIIYQYFNGTDIVIYRAHDIFTVIPIEFGIKWPLPVSSENFKIYIGGGAGFYFGSHTRFVDSLTSTTTNLKPGFSLNISAGLDYYIGKNLAANIELKFRDASFDTESKYNYITSLRNPFSTRLIVDGVRVSSGLKYNF